MKTRLLFAILLLVASVQLQAQDPLEDEIAAALKGKVVTLRHFYADNVLHYNADGELLGKSESGPWTLSGRLQIDKVAVKDDHVQLEGIRAWVTFNGGSLDTQVNALTGIPISVRVDLVQGPERLAKWRSALPKVFFTRATPLWEDAPSYWQRFLGGTKTEVKQPPTESDHASAVEQPPLRVRISEGVSVGILLHKENPSYPREARAAHREGRVVMRAVIGKDGHIQDLQVLQPSGMGLDDASADAVRKWLYRPYFLKGEPVEVETQITVNFTLRPN